MGLASDDPQRFTLLMLLILAATIVSSVGFQALTGNPLVPEATLNASDARDDGTGEVVRYFTVEHVSGEPVNVSNIEIVIGLGNIVLGEANDWTARNAKFVYRAQTESGPIDADYRLTEGDHLLVTYRPKSGQPAAEASWRIRVRIRHIAAQQQLLDQVIPIRIDRAGPVGDDAPG